MRLIREGLANFRLNVALWPGLYAGRLGLALLFTLPFFIIVDSGLSRSAFAEVLMQRWSVDVLAEYFATHENVFVNLLVFLIFLGLASFLVRQFIAGGIYHAYMSGSRTTLALFWSESGCRFKGHIKISALMIPVYAVLVIVGMIFSSLVPDDTFGPFLEDSLKTNLLQVVIVFVLITPGLLISELLRLRLAASPEEKLSDAFRAVLNFLWRNIVRLYGSYLAYFVPFVVIWLVVEKSALMITGNLGNSLGVAVELILFQICALAQVAQSLLFVATVGPILRSEHPGRFRQTIQGELGLD